MQPFEFHYNQSNLSASILDIAHFGNETMILIWGLIISILAISFLYKLCLYVYGYTLILRDARSKQSKKNTIQELILMKTIQDELEREIEESLLSSAFTKTPQAG